MNSISVFHCNGTLIIVERLLLLATSAFIFCHYGEAQSDQSQPANNNVAQRDYSNSIPYQPRVFPTPANAKKKAKKPKQAKETTSTAALANTFVENKPMTLHVSVLDTQAQPIKHLTKASFKLFVDGKELEISSVEPASRPVNYLFLIDASPSTVERTKKIRANALRMFEQLSPDDRAMVIKFDGDVKVLCDMTADRQIVEKAIRKATAQVGNGTALYDAVTEISEKLIPKIPGRNAVLLFTDGVDTTSRRSSYDTSLAQAETLDAAYYPVYFDTLQSAVNAMSGAVNLSSMIGSVVLPSGARSSSKYDVKQEYEIGKLYLTDLVFLSGGRATNARDGSDINVPPAPNIPSEIKQQYAITFTPTGQYLTGLRRQIVVRVNRPNLAVITRGSYIVGSN